MSRPDIKQNIPEQTAPNNGSLVKEMLTYAAISTPQVASLILFAYSTFNPSGTVDTSTLVTRNLQPPEHHQALTAEEAEEILGSKRSILNNPPGVLGIGDFYGLPENADLADLPATYLNGKIYSLPLSNPPAEKNQDTATLAAIAIKLAGGDQSAQDYARENHEIVRPANPSKAGIFSPHAWLTIKANDGLVRELAKRTQEFELRAITGLTAALFLGAVRLAHRFNKMQKYQEQGGQIGCYEQGKFITLGGVETANLLASWLIAANNWPATTAVMAFEGIKTILAIKGNNKWLKALVESHQSKKKQSRQQTLNADYRDVEKYLLRQHSRLPNSGNNAPINRHELAYLVVEADFQRSVAEGEPYTLDDAHQTYEDFSDPRYFPQHLSELTKDEINSIKIKRITRKYADLESDPNTAMNPPKTRAQYEEAIRARFAKQSK